ncbi:MAG: CoA-transferase [Christensenellaceae bacterium]|nr:CoA-transferase [Eubacteriales bacterium]MEA5069439.1 CoA-transferase [Christensenellaceae bacterium]
MTNQTPSKVMSAQEAIARFVSDGDYIACGGFVTNRRVYGLVYEMIRQRKKNLYIMSGCAGGDVDMLIGAGCVQAINISYIANAGFTPVCRRFRDAVENGKILYEDYSLDVQAIVCHGASLGLPYVPVKNMLGSDLERKWGIPEEERKNHPKIPAKKFVIQDDPFEPGSRLCCVPTPKLDAALLHVHTASPDGTFRIIGPAFEDEDLAIAAKHTIITCENLVSDEYIRAAPEKNTCSGLCVDAVVHMPYGAHPTQCYGVYDYDPQYLLEYDEASKTQEGFDAFLEKYVWNAPTREAYLDVVKASHLAGLRAQPGLNYTPGLKRRNT